MTTTGTILASKVLRLGREKIISLGDPLLLFSISEVNILTCGFILISNPSKKYEKKRKILTEKILTVFFNKKNWLKKFLTNIFTFRNFLLPAKEKFFSSFRTKSKNLPKKLNYCEEIFKLNESELFLLFFSQNFQKKISPILPSRKFFPTKLKINLSHNSLSELKQA